MVDAQTITATTPPGSAGLANVTVLQGDKTDVLVGGFLYQSEMDLLVVDPAQGSQAGGTVVSLLGSGFPDDATVLVDGSPATHVVVHSPTKITARTPPSGYQVRSTSRSSLPRKGPSRCHGRSPTTTQRAPLEERGVTRLTVT